MILMFFMLKKIIQHRDAENTKLYRDIAFDFLFIFALLKN